MDNKQISHEQIAHDLTVALCAKSFPSEKFPAGNSDIDDFVQRYNELYDQVLKSVNLQV